MDFVQRSRQLDRKLTDDRREIVFYGPRGSDALYGLRGVLPHVAGVFSLSDRFPIRLTQPGEEQKYRRTLEDRTFLRRLSRGFDEDVSSKVGETKFIQDLFDCFNCILVRRSTPLVIAYEPHAPLMTEIDKHGRAIFGGNDLATFQRCSKKPPLEKALREQGVPIIEWKTVRSPADVDALFEIYDSLVIRRDGGSSGKGIIHVNRDTFDDETRNLIRLMGHDHNSHVSASPYHADSIPMNMTGVIFPAKTPKGKAHVARFPLSAQIIGPPSLTDLRFGYCGNDYKFVEQVPDHILDAHDDLLDTVGQHLASQGYVGVFGIDTLYLPSEDIVLFTEVNPRFQGSTRVIGEMVSAIGQSDPIMEHLAAVLGLKPGPVRTARQWRDEINPLSHMYLHNTSPTPIVAPPDALETHKSGVIYMGDDPNAPKQDIPQREMWPGRDVLVEPGAVMNRIVVRGGVLDKPGILTPAALRLVHEVQGQYRAVTDRTIGLDPGPQSPQRSFP